jgi:hypothetical protein
MNFEECVKECCEHRDLIQQFNRLTGRHVLSNIYDTRPPIVKMIDESTGYQKELDSKAHDDFQAFIIFIFEYIWLPVITTDC